jgi:hypothetical protein
VAQRAVRRGTPSGAVGSLISYLTDNWLLHSGEYSFYTGRYLGDLPYARLVEVAYFLAHREYVRRIDTEENTRARDRAQSGLDAQLLAAETDADTGLPAWVVAAGIQPADGSPLIP